MPYTPHDTPAIVERVGADLRLVADTVRANDPHLRSLVLTGGFARGEGTMSQGKPLNDYDLLALRGWGRPRVPYGETRDRLEKTLGLHVDLAPVAAARLRWVRPTLFWLEVARCGRTLWGAELLHRLPEPSVSQVERGEALRLLANRAAGLLLYQHDALPEVRLQACKALLAALDAHLLSIGIFPALQRDRWLTMQGLRANGSAPTALLPSWRWMEWANAYKQDPDATPREDAGEAWSAAAGAVLDAVPAALRMAGLDSLSAGASRDRWSETLLYAHRSAHVDGARRWMRHPAARLRVATLRMLQDAQTPGRSPALAAAQLQPFAQHGRVADPIRFLDALRHAAPQ